MKTNRIRWLIPLFLFFGILFFCSLTAYAAPTAPTSVSVTIQKDGTTVTQAAKGSKITISAQASGGSGNNAHYEYGFSYKTQGSSTWNNIKAISTTQSVNFTLSESGSYTFRITARVSDSSGNSQTISKDVSFKSVAITNKSTISSSAVTLGESVTINASAEGGTNYEYYYSVSKDGGTSYVPIQPSTSSAQYTASASCTYKPASEGNYMLRVIARDKSTGSTDQKVFSVTATAEAIVNKCDVSSNNIEITSKGTAVTLTFAAEKGKAPYKYRCSYTVVNSSDPAEYVYGDSSNFTSGKTSIAYTLKKVGTHKFKFEVQDSSSPPKTSEVIKTVDVTTNLTNTSSISSNTTSNKSGLNFACSATGGTSEYEYKLSYRFEDETKKDLTFFDTSSTIGIDIPNVLKQAKKDSDFTGTITFIISVRDRNTSVVREKEFNVDITVPSADAITRQDLMNLLSQVNNWESGFSAEQRKGIDEIYTGYSDAKKAAQSAAASDIMQDYASYYWELLDQWNFVQLAPGLLASSKFWMTEEIDKIVKLERQLFEDVSGWFSSFSQPDVSTSTFSFNIEDFVNEFSQIFVIFASSLLVILFGVNIIKTALEYQLFTLKGAVSVFGRLILAEFWIQLSTKICVMVVKIFSELMSSILSSIHTSLLNEISNLKFEADRSGIWLVGDIVDFFVNLCPFLLVLLLVGITIVIFVIVYIKLIIRTLEIAMLSVISPVFFACSVGEATMPYFRKFITAFLSVAAEIVFMGVVYLAFLWYCKGAIPSEGINLTDLYDLSKPVAGQFYTFVAVTVACGIMMIKPPQVLRDLMR